MFSSIESDCRRGNNSDSVDLIRRRGGSLARADYSTTGQIKVAKRSSELDATLLEGYQTGSGKFMNLIKSGLHLSKFKSKSKINLQEQRQSLHLDSQASKSEENLADFSFNSFRNPIKVSNILLNQNNPTMYVTISKKGGESSYMELVVLNKHCTVQAVHPSIVSGKNYCFQIIKGLQSEISQSHFRSMKVAKETMSDCQISKSSSFNTRLSGNDKLLSLTCGPAAIIQCQSVEERNEWIMRLKKHINPNIDNQVRHEDILRIWIQEAKNLSAKKRYFCEIKLDQVVYGRTTTKLINDNVFWGEEFEFPGLKTVREISISIYKIVDSKKKGEKSELCAVINIPCSDLCQNTFTEKWYSCSTDTMASNENIRLYMYKSILLNNPEESARAGSEAAPTIRIKARYRPLEIIPIKCYQGLIDCLQEDNIALVVSLEAHLKVKSKEELVNSLLMILESKKGNLKFLANIVLMEVFKSGDQNVLLRGNSMASKAMECFLKMTGQKYLTAILSDVIEKVTSEVLDVEVDPLRFQNPKDQSVIVNNQKVLLSLVELVWNKICDNSHMIPNDVKSVFTMIRDKLAANNPAPPTTTASTSLPMIDQVVSSCIFLRYICPAIMSPFLFGLTTEYSDKGCINRTFTLIAKCIQSLANFSDSYTGKETYMGFLQDFLASKTEAMHFFLREISTSSPELDHVENNPHGSAKTFDFPVDAGYQLAEISYQLTFHLTEIPQKEYTPVLIKLRTILEEISKLKSESEDRMNSRSLIPVRRLSASQSSAWSQLEPRPKIISSTTTPKSLVSEISEQFSYIPDKVQPIKSASKGAAQRMNHDNYVDFESLDRKLREKPSIELASNVINEKEIKNDWINVVKEITTPPPPINKPSVDTNYQGIYATQSLSNQFSFPNSEQTHHQSNSPKLTPNRHPNIYRRIQRNSNPGKSQTNSTSPARPKFSVPNLGTSIEYFPFESLDNGSSSDTNSIGSGKSAPRNNQQNRLNNKTNQRSFSSSRSFEGTPNSWDTRRPSASNICRKSSYAIPNSISSNADLDSFLGNEISRLELLLKYYNVPLPVFYKGSITDQFNCKTLDESSLKRVLLKKPHLNRDDIISHITASYRLLKSYKRPGQYSKEFTLKAIMEINRCIQEIINKEYRTPPSHQNVNTGKPTTVSLTRSQSNIDPSIKSPLSKFSKQSRGTESGFGSALKQCQIDTFPKPSVGRDVVERC